MLVTELQEREKFKSTFTITIIRLLANIFFISILFLIGIYEIGC